MFWQLALPEGKDDENFRISAHMRGLGRDLLLHLPS